MQTYRYDSLNRLTEAKEMSGANQTWKQFYSYDRFGNRSGFYQKIGNQDLPIDNHSNPQIDQTTNRFAASQGYTYDKNGNITTDADGRQFVFNGENKQTEVRDANNNVIGQYFYDGEGKRVKKVTQTATVTFVYSGGKLVAEYSSQPPPQNPTTSYTATDPLGSPRVITNAQGNVISRRDFMPFGEELLPEGVYRTTNQNYTYGDTIRQKFTGYQKDEETQLDYAEARYYNNKHARFTAVDPLLASGKSANPQTFNRYAYVGNNPVNITDPLGLTWYYNQTARSYNWYNEDTGKFLWGGGGLTDEWKTVRNDTSLDATGAGSFNYQAGGAGWVTLNASSATWSSSAERPYVPATPGTDNNAIRTLAKEVTQGVDDGLSGMAKGVGNFGISTVNGMTQPFGIAGLAFGVRNPFAVSRFSFNNAREASYSSASETGTALGTLFTGATFSSGSASSLNLNNCFVAGTLITTENGLVPIEEIKAGNKVLSYNTETGGLEYEEVVRLFRNTADEFLKIQVEGEAELIQVTLGHPFYVHRNRSNLSADAEADGDWILSKSLRVGDLLKDRTGAWKPILSIEKVAETKATYNFEVAQNHDYFVGQNGWLVHNQSIWTSTGSKTSVQNAFSHWGKHKAEFPEFLNSKQYVEGAKNFLNNPPTGVLTRTRANGDVLLYETSTNTFGVRTFNGTPRTMFRPDPAKHGFPTNLDYFLSQ